MRISHISALKEQLKVLRSLLRRASFWAVLTVDISLIIIAHLLAYAFRFDFQIILETSRIIAMLPFLIAVKIPIFYFFGLYRGMWRYTSIADLFNISKAVAASSGFIIMSVLYLNRFQGYSRTVFFMDGVFCFLLICMHRGAIRYLLRNGELLAKFKQNGEYPRRAKRLLLIGAGAAAEKVIREIQDNQGVPYEVVALVDDDYKKHGLRIHGIPIIGSTRNLRDCALRANAEELLITISSATSEQMKRIVEVCRHAETPFKVLPSMGEIIKGKLTVSAIRDVDYRDLLGRPIVHLEQDKIGDLLTGRTIVVTGAGGTIGSELCRQIVSFNPAKLILIDAAEENLYKIQMELHHERAFHNYIPVLAKIQNKALLDTIFAEHKPSMVLHAAAYKHVPLIEANPWEAITNNVFATKCLIDTAISHKTERFVLVSTDKAVRPTNVMGASKRLTELLMLEGCRKDCHTSFMAVRFGNVLGSSGSVIPLFKKQIAQGGPVTVTDPEITRYFMSIDEAAQLILQAGTMGTGGEIFILKMGEPVKIVNLARDLITLMGYEPGKDIEIIFTGLRPGEKRYEELITEGEGIAPTRHDKIMVLHCDSQCRLEREQILQELLQEAKVFNAAGIKKTLRELIPEYIPDEQAHAIIGEKAISSFQSLLN